MRRKLTFVEAEKHPLAPVSQSPVTANVHIQTTGNGVNYKPITALVNQTSALGVATGGHRLFGIDVGAGDDRTVYGIVQTEDPVCARRPTVDEITALVELCRLGEISLEDCRRMVTDQFGST
jgi:hypothetical protein